MDKPWVKASFLELAVNVACGHGDAAGFGRTPCRQDVKAAMRDGLAVEPQSMAVKAPAQSAVLLEAGRGRYLLEGDPLPFERGVRAPEALRSSKIRQARVDAHARAGANQNGTGFSYEGSGPPNKFVDMRWGSAHAWMVWASGKKTKQKGRL